MLGKGRNRSARRGHSDVVAGPRSPASDSLPPLPRGPQLWSHRRMRSTSAMATATTILMTILATAGPARAQQRSPPGGAGFDLGLTVGFALPYGDAVGGTGGAHDAVVSSLVPVVVDAGYRINRMFTIGLFGQYAIAQLKSGECPQGASCLGTFIAAGAEAICHLPVAGRLAPRFGAGVGYEWLQIDISEPDLATTLTSSTTFRGAMLGLFEVGFDYRLAPELALGPIISFSFARYDRTSSMISIADNTTTTLPSSSMEIPMKTVHEWLMIGVRGVFSL